MRETPRLAARAVLFLEELVQLAGIAFAGMGREPSRGEPAVRPAVEVPVAPAPAAELSLAETVLRQTDDLKKIVETVEREVIDRAMRRVEGNQSRGAQILNISRGSLIAKLKEFGIPDYRYLRRERGGGGDGGCRTSSYGPAFPNAWVCFRRPASPVPTPTRARTARRSVRRSGRSGSPPPRSCGRRRRSAPRSTGPRRVAYSDSTWKTSASTWTQPERGRREPEARRTGAARERMRREGEERREQDEVEVDVGRRQARAAARREGSPTGRRGSRRRGRERRDRRALEEPEQRARRARGDGALVGRGEHEPEGERRRESRPRARSRRPPVEPEPERRSAAQRVLVRRHARRAASAARPLLLARRPEQEEEHPAEHDDRLPEHGVRGGEEGRPVRADPEERDDAHEVEDLDRREAEREAEQPARPRRREGEDGRAEEQRGLDAVAAVLDVDGETAERISVPDDRDLLAEDVQDRPPRRARRPP